MEMSDELKRLLGHRVKSVENVLSDKDVRIRNEPLDNLKIVSKDWNCQLKQVLDEGDFSYLRIRENNPNALNPSKYRISILARSSWRGDGFGDPRSSNSKKLSAGKTQILYKVGGFAAKENGQMNFYLGQVPDDNHNIVKVYTGETVRKNMPEFDKSELEEMVSDVAEKYRGSPMSKDFLREVAQVTNDYVTKFK